MNDDLMTPDEVCALLKVTKDWLYDQVQARRIPHVRLGRHLRFSRLEVLDYVRANSVVAQEAEPGRAKLTDGSAPTSSGKASRQASTDRS